MNPDPNLSKVAMSCAVSDSLSLLWGSGTGSTQCGRTKAPKVSEKTSRFRSTTGTTTRPKKTSDRDEMIQEFFESRVD